MDYQTALEKVNSRLRFGIKPGLERITALLKLLGNPEKKLHFVHIAGTNGKGSASSLIASALTECGYKTGLFTSPYIMDFRERFQIDGVMISKEALIAVIQETDAAARQLEAGGEPITEFEFITAAALLWFYKSGCDFVSLEVGLGGRFDATTAIQVPDVAVIMQIAMDHTLILGDSLEKIAYEKAGIIKAGGRVALYPLQDPAVCSVIREVCKARNAQLTLPDLEPLLIEEAGLKGSRFSYDGTALCTPFGGKHQIVNALTAYTALQLLREQGVSLPPEKLYSGFQKACMPARMEVISEKPLVLLDGGHNPGCARALRQMLLDFTPGYQRIGVMGMMADKDIHETLRIIAPMFRKIYAVPMAEPRALKPAAFAEAAGAYCPEVQVLADRKEVLKLLDAMRDPSTMAVVCGSFYLAGSVRALIKDKVGSQRSV